jgi:hypothetical protein
MLEKWNIGRMENKALSAFGSTIPASPDESVRTGIPTFQLLLASFLQKAGNTPLPNVYHFDTGSLV